MNHAIKIEDLDMTLDKANALEELFTQTLLDLGFSSYRIEAVDCRRVSGFIPYSHNKGGLQARCYRDQWSAQFEGTGFENTDKILNKYYDYDYNSFLKENNLTELDYNNDSQMNDFDEYCRDSDSTVEFMVRFMVTSENEVHLNMYVSASDSPYHRSSDDRLELDIKYKTLSGLKKQISKHLKSDFALNMKKNIRESF